MRVRIHPQFRNRKIIKMIFKSLKAVLISTLLIFTSSAVYSEVMPQSAKFKAATVNKDMNVLFQEAFKACALEMDNDFEMSPFAMIKKTDGTIGFFIPPAEQKDRVLTVDQQIASVRRLLIDLASTNQIVASVQAQYVSVAQGGKIERQGIVFELEHKQGLSLMRFLPVSEVKDEAGKVVGLNFETDKLSTGSKKQIVFSPSIVQ